MIGKKNHKRKKYWTFIIVGLLLMLIASSFVALMIGEVSLSPQALVQALFSSDGGITQTILYKIRIPRIILAIAVGGALSLSGVLLQGIYHNPLVEPYTLGISGGAALGVGLAISFGVLNVVGIYTLPFAGFLGAVCVVALVYSMNMRDGIIHPQRMLLTGVMISFICSSAMMLLMSLSTADELHSIVFWTMGSLDESNSKLIMIAVLTSFLGLGAAYFFTKPLNALRMGKEKAIHLGVNTDRSIKYIFILSSLLTGVSVAVGGIIGFVGLVVPHIIRRLVGSDHRILLITSFLSGSIFILICDTIARTIIRPNELPIGVITGIIGGVVFIFIMSKKWKH